MNIVETTYCPICGGEIALCEYEDLKFKVEPITCICKRKQEEKENNE